MQNKTQRAPYCVNMESRRNNAIHISETQLFKAVKCRLAGERCCLECGRLRLRDKSDNHGNHGDVSATKA